MRNHWSALRSTTPSPTITQKITTPQASPVMRNASDTITGANVPKVSMPITLRKITTMQAITGKTRIRLIAWSGTCASTAADHARTRLRRKPTSSRTSSAVMTCGRRSQSDAASTIGTPSIRLARAMFQSESNGACGFTSTSSPGPTRR